jgi:hypothetical protein
MQIQVDASEIQAEASLLKSAPQRFFLLLEKELTRIGEKGVSVAKSYRRGGTTATKTAVRTGRALGSYGQRIKREGDGFVQDIGAIISEGSRSTGLTGVPLHVRMLEGIDAAGNSFETMIIRAKNKPYLVFPIRQGGGLARKNITGWVSKKQITYRARPSLPYVAKAIAPMLQEAPGKAFLLAIKGEI